MLRPHKSPDKQTAHRPKTLQSPIRPPKPKETDKVRWATEDTTASGSGTCADLRAVDRDGPVLVFRYPDWGIPPAQTSDLGFLFNSAWVPLMIQPPVGGFAFRPFSTPKTHRQKGINDQTHMLEPHTFIGHSIPAPIHHDASRRVRVASPHAHASTSAPFVPVSLPNRGHRTTAQSRLPKAPRRPDNSQLKRAERRDDAGVLFKLSPCSRQYPWLPKLGA